MVLALSLGAGPSFMVRRASCMGSGVDRSKPWTSKAIGASRVQDSTRPGHDFGCGVTMTPTPYNGLQPVPLFTTFMFVCTSICSQWQAHRSHVHAKHPYKQTLCSLGPNATLPRISNMPPRPFDVPRRIVCVIRMFPTYISLFLIQNAYELYKLANRCVLNGGWPHLSNNWDDLMPYKPILWI